MKYLFKFLVFIIITVALAYALYHTGFGKTMIDTRIQEIQNQWIANSGNQSETITGIVVDPGNPGNPLPSNDIPSTVLGKRLEYYRANKAVLGVQE